MAVLSDCSVPRSPLPFADGARPNRKRISTDRELWRTYRRTRDAALRDRLIEDYIPLVKYVAAGIARRLPSHLGLDDLCSSGLLGLSHAAELFDPERGVEFSAYALPRIRGAIVDELRRLDCLPRVVRRRIREAERAMLTLSQRLGRFPTGEQVAGELGVNVEEYRHLLTESVTLLSLDASLGTNDGAAPIDTLEDVGSPDPFLTVAAREQQAILRRMVDDLPERQRQALLLYYYVGLRMHEAAQVMGLTESRVSQLHSSAVLHLRAGLRRRGLGPEDLVFSVGPEATPTAALGGDLACLLGSKTAMPTDEYTSSGASQRAS